MSPAVSVLDNTFERKMIDVPDQEIKEAQRHCQATNPDFPFARTRGYAKAYLRGKREIEQRVKDISGQSGLKEK